jgi:cell volume regulation protein A
VDPTVFLLALAGIFLIGTVGELIFQKTNLPDVVWLILAGIVLGPVTGLLPKEALGGIAPYFAAITLVVVLFDGGSALKLKELSRAAPRSGALAVVGFVLSVAGIAASTMVAALMGLLPSSWTWTHGILTGAIVGGSSSIIIMPALGRAKLRPNLTNLVNLESALTDALCVVSTTAIVDIMAGGGASGAGAPLVALGKSFGIGLGIGAVAGMFWLLFLRFLKDSEHAYPITLSVLLLLYVGIDHLGGSAALGILTVAVILGNAPSLSSSIGLVQGAELDENVRGFHKQMTFIVKSFFFVFIGAMLGPPWDYVLVGIALGGVLLAVRIPAVLVATVKSNFVAAEKKLAAVCMPRGMAAGVLATLPVTAGIAGTEKLPVAVFTCVFTTIATFAIGFPLLKRDAPAADAEPVPAEPPKAPELALAAGPEPAPLGPPFGVPPAGVAPPPAALPAAAPSDPGSPPTQASPGVTDSDPSGWPGPGGMNG